MAASAADLHFLAQAKFKKREEKILRGLKMTNGLSQSAPVHKPGRESFSGCAVALATATLKLET
jgi:hypothetical protein